MLREIGPTIAFQRAIERSLLRLISRGYAFARSTILPEAHIERRRFQADDFSSVREHIEELRAQAAAAEAVALAEIGRAVVFEEVRHRRRFTAVVQAQTNINLANLLADDDLLDVLSLSSEEHARLVKSLSSDVVNRIEQLAISSILEGKSNAQTAKELRKLQGINAQRAKLIARDQASKLNGAMNEYRQTQAGITEYDWYVTRDGRQRDSHDANHKKRFKWNKPPSTGHPGHEINCRCRARGVIPVDPDDV